SYDAGEPYASGDIVESGGSLYMAMVANPTSAPPSAGWELFLPGATVADGTIDYPKLSPAVAQQINSAVIFTSQSLDETQRKQSIHNIRNPLRDLSDLLNDT